MSKLTSKIDSLLEGAGSKDDKKNAGIVIKSLKAIADAYDNIYSVFEDDFGKDDTKIIDSLPDTRSPDIQNFTEDSALDMEKWINLWIKNLKKIK